ncbi:MAG: T9SS type A sorting domain-containing protein [bacterium]|nr:T9SS type A sorting domain-containing protein [bacterium]
MKRILVFVISILILSRVNGQTEIFAPGSYIINMGSPTQTIENGLKPYGLVYELLKNYHVPIKWIIGSSKVKDGKDFTYASVDYKGGTFIIPYEFITPSISARINAWSASGVIGIYTKSALALNVSQTLTSVPKWTLNLVNVSISKSFFVDAGIPSSAYSTANPSTLSACNDIFVMPHADPTWATHGNLYNWNRNNLGSIWAGCHSVSALENLVNPLNPSEQMNFLSTKGLMPHNSHNDGSAPFRYFFNRKNYNGGTISSRPDDQVFQMIGSEDVAHTNGSEQVYIPNIGSSWRNSTHIGCYDSIQSNVTANASNGPAAVTLYGRGFGLNTSGFVMYQGGHDIQGTNEANIAAVRQFFNFSLMVMREKTPTVNMMNVPSQIQEGTTYHVSIEANSPTNATLYYQWSASCPGNFADPNSANTTFTPNNINKNISYTITCVITDACSRYSFESKLMTGMAILPVNLINFTATQIDKRVQINWTTADEDNLSGFEIFRSENGNDFEMVSEIKVKTSSNNIKYYEQVDDAILKLGLPIIYYKLKILNNDGSFQWSSTVKLNISKNYFESDVLIFPNPCTDYINVELKELSETNFKIEIIDAYGKIVMAFSNQMLNFKTFKIDVNELETGIYFLNLEVEGEVKLSNKFVKR